MIFGYVYVNNILFISTLRISQPKPYFFLSSAWLHRFSTHLRPRDHVFGIFGLSGQVFLCGETTGLRHPKTWYQQGIWTPETYRNHNPSGPGIGSVPSRKLEALEKHIAIWRDPTGWLSKKTGASPGHFLIQSEWANPRHTNQLLTNSGN